MTLLSLKFHIFQITLTEEQQFVVDERSNITSVTHLCNNAKMTAQKLLNHYVKVQGLAISQVTHLRNTPL